MAELEAGDRARIGIAPDVVGEIVEKLEEPGWVSFRADGQRETHPFHQDSFVKI